jgi:hypothetical protein
MAIDTKRVMANAPRPYQSQTARSQTLCQAAFKQFNESHGQAYQMHKSACRLGPQSPLPHEVFHLPTIAPHGLDINKTKCNYVIHPPNLQNFGYQIDVPLIFFPKQYNDWYGYGMPGVSASYYSNKKW